MLQTLFNIFFSTFIESSSLSCSLIFSLFSSYSTSTGDPHTTCIDSTFPTNLRTQLHILYSDALNNTEPPTRWSCFYPTRVYNSELNIKTYYRENFYPAYSLVSLFYSPIIDLIHIPYILDTDSIPTRYRLNIDSIQTHFMSLSQPTFYIQPTGCLSYSSNT